jgi:glycosyltransferase involved in cell wall biosynthesis
MKNYNEPLVSFATPVYNGELYLAECIESILSQTYKNWEYIIVNNCSKDSSLAIAKSYAEKDQRISIHDNKNFLSALQNFNHMLRLISPESKYCKIVHADDWIFPECVEKMVALAEESPSVGIVGSYRLANNKVESDGLPYTQSVFPGRDIARMNLTSGPYVFGSPSALLIRCDLIRPREKFYNEAHSGADGEACLELLQECDFGFVHQVLSFSRLHRTSITWANLSIQASFANHIYKHKKYGPVYLSPEEYKAGMKFLTTAYYRFLGSQIMRLNDKKFWDYHRNAMENLLEMKMSWARVAQGALFCGFRRLVDTKQTLKNIFRAVRGTYKKKKSQLATT